MELQPLIPTKYGNDDLLKNIMSNDKIADEAIQFEDEDPFADLDVDESDVK